MKPRKWHINKTCNEVLRVGRRGRLDNYQINQKLRIAISQFVNYTLTNQKSGKY
ncbi:hypothetical protein RchiOBHm_Chr1g0337431 [Rosa chinensis]|uniref:Uncharacterized protein n=1 Tax=Rosa chinensis TaxID=74649 RepID=A0A2P6SCX8_ROSCH|nr:hypothetical protein RchiOBHm_Chr1g0337431 [Rosa chinensis]